MLVLGGGGLRAKSVCALTRKGWWSKISKSERTYFIDDHIHGSELLAIKLFS